MKTSYLETQHWASINLMDINPSTYLITGIEVHRDSRGNGYASALLDDVCRDADRENITLMLSVDPDGTGLDEQTLVDWYTRKGFKPLAIDLTSMVREPNKENA